MRFNNQTDHTGFLSFPPVVVPASITRYASYYT
ncbi:hypothetical protein EV199_0594 [Pseudobacter ginsenosidimutans]|uniref:Uncharacterized protein n=1 Tax=Pseudobacter ginsenosidimutans TaxID=661488 RepID=A0A4Q7N0F4_9BACT|nr:hypothetical protein EV199_0594 [Pseudobacter ginsenosidimutans]